MGSDPAAIRDFAQAMEAEQCLRGVGLTIPHRSWGGPTRLFSDRPADFPCWHGAVLLATPLAAEAQPSGKVWRIEYLSQVIE